MRSDQITVRLIIPADAPAVAALAAANRSTTGGAVQAHAQVQPEHVASLLESGAVGVTAEVPGYKGLVGMGWMAHGECWYEGAKRPYAFLFNLLVHPAYRRRGIMQRMADFRLAMAREQFGSEVVIYCVVDQSNRASQAGVAKWRQYQLVGRVVRVVVPMRTRAPHPLAGIEVRQAAGPDLEAFDRLHDEVYCGYNLLPVSAAGTGASGPREDTSGESWIATDRHGRPVAGLVLEEAGRLAPVRVEQMAWPARLANVFIRLIPPDGVIRPIRARRFWFTAGHEAAARHLWESARWLWRERGTQMTTQYDSHSPLARVVPGSRLIPRRRSVLFVAGPVPMQAERLVYVQNT